VLASSTYWQACIRSVRQLGLPHAGKTAEVSVEAGIYQITVEPGITITAARDHQPRHPAAQGLQLRLMAMDAQVGQSCWQSVQSMAHCVSRRTSLDSSCPGATR
jgi:hypothetical protein